MPDVALCVFATGRYKEFLADLADSARQHFLRKHNPQLIAFTDGTDVPPGFDQQIYVPHLKWPYGTLYRYRWLHENASHLKDYRYIYMCDADMRFVSTVSSEVMGRLVAVLHAGHIKKSANSLPYIRNPRSQAYVRIGRGKHYYAGGFQGGAASKYLTVCAKIAAAIYADETRGIIAEWHDESHWNAYLSNDPPSVALSPQYCWGEPDGCPRGTKILALAKEHALYRSDGDDPKSKPTTIVKAEPAPQLETGVPESVTEFHQIIEELNRGKLTASTRAQLVSLLQKCKAVVNRAEPQVMHAGPQGRLESVLREHLPSGPIIYVDVGASEPIDCSNTWPFYQDGGHGLLIEPRVSCWYAILLQRPRDRLWPKAVASQEGWATMKLCDACSSLDHSWTNETRGELTVQTEPLESILARFPDIRDNCHLCSIDTEGTEEDVIVSADWNIFRPRVIVIEYASFSNPALSSQRAIGINSLMASQRYQPVFQDDINIVFKRIVDD